ncbi:CIPK25 [Symbiodinium sp. CCMP2592]|nr:CIPK25 [Symbiodinium sp. CCMP2592]
MPRPEAFAWTPEPPPLSEPGQTEDVDRDGDATRGSEVPETQKDPEPEAIEPAPERAVHRFYGFEAGSIFFIPPCELYFTQDSIKSGFKDSGSFGHSSGYSSSDSPGPKARDSVKTSSVREMFDAILQRRMLKREVEMMDVVFHEGYYYSICNRRLAVYLLLWLCGRCPRLKVQLVSKTDRKVHWDRRFTTECDGDWILVRQTGEAIGRRFQDTTFEHPELARALSRAGGEATK